MKNDFNKMVQFDSGNLNVDKLTAHDNVCSYQSCVLFVNPANYNSTVSITNSSFFNNTGQIYGLGYAAAGISPESGCVGSNTGRLNLSMVNNSFYNTGMIGMIFICSADKSSISLINNTIADNDLGPMSDYGFLGTVYEPELSPRPDLIMQNNILNNNYSYWGRGDGQFYNPQGIALDNAGNVYVADPNNNRIQIFNSSGVYQSQFGTSGSGDGQFNEPQGVALDSSGNIYVADTFNNRIQVFNSSGVYQSQFGTNGNGDGQFNGPEGIALDTTGNIYVADSSNNRIQVFNSSGVYQSQFGTSGSGDGQFSNPEGIDLDNSGNIYVADTYNNRIQVFNSSGVYQSQFGTSGSGDGQFNNPRGIALDGSGNIYVADMDNNRIQKFNSAGVYQSQFGVTATGTNPSAIALDSSGYIYVLDANVQKFNSSGVFMSFIPGTAPLAGCPVTGYPSLVTPTSLGGNISGDDTCTPFFTAPNDKNNTDPMLGAITTQYPFVMPITQNSPAFNNGIASGAPSTDERGVARPQYGAFDSGAYELADPANGGGNLASTGFDMKMPAIIASVLALSGIAIAGYSLKRR